MVSCVSRFNLLTLKLVNSIVKTGLSREFSVYRLETKWNSGVSEIVMFNNTFVLSHILVDGG
jgi:hypothetical protein